MVGTLDLPVCLLRVLPLEASRVPRKSRQLEPHLVMPFLYLLVSMRLPANFQAMSVNQS